MEKGKFDLHSNPENRRIQFGKAPERRAQRAVALLFRGKCQEV